LVNHKRVERIYRQERLSLRVKKRKKLKALSRIALPRAVRPDQQWSMDFIHDRLWEGRKFRSLSIVDTFTHECLALEVDTSLGGERVKRVLERLVSGRGLPEAITVDNGPEFISQVVDEWAYRRGVKLDFIRPGKPTDNPFVESFHDKFRDECLDDHYFSTLFEARAIIEEWRIEFNTLPAAQIPERLNAGRVCTTTQQNPEALLTTGLKKGTGQLAPKNHCSRNKDHRERCLPLRHLSLSPSETLNQYKVTAGYNPALHIPRWDPSNIPLRQHRYWFLSEHRDRKFLRGQEEGSSLGHAWSALDIWL